MKKPTVYVPHNKIRIVTAASLFDGHDAAINIMRRIIQSSGAEVIHLGHDRSVQEVVDCAIQEDVQAIAMTSYQGGHMEYFKYMYDLLKEKGAAVSFFRKRSVNCMHTASPGSIHRTTVARWACRA